MDTDHVNLLEWAAGSAGQRLHERIRALPESDVATTIISFEEQTRGWLAFQASARTLDRQANAYRKLKRHLEVYCEMRVLEFDAEAAATFQRLKQSRIRVGTMDLKIAAITLNHNATLLTKNLRDFNKVPGLNIEDWSAS
jgi:tRNA(fMet)-specific endonuclease VapC